MKEIVLISSVVVSALLFFLVYKTMKNETQLKMFETQIKFMCFVCFQKCLKNKVLLFLFCNETIKIK